MLTQHAIGQRKITARQRLIMVASALAFLISTGASAVRLFDRPVAQPQPIGTELSEAETLALQVRGYETVLQREPHNPIALEGMASAHLRLNNPQAAIVPLEKLVKQYPDRADYRTQLAAARQQLASK